MCVCSVLGSPLSFCWSSEWVVRSKRRLETLNLHTHRGKLGITGNNTNAAQQRVEHAEAFFQMCHINLVDPQHEAVAPPHSSPRQQRPENNYSCVDIF